MLKSSHNTTAESVRINKELNAIVSLSATLCNTSLAKMHLLKNTDYFIDTLFNLQRQYSPFCNYVYKNDTPTIIIPDASKDERFCQLESVVSNSIRFYAGVRLEDKSGNTIG